MSILGNLMREISKTAANVGEALVNGVADVTEVVTGPNQVTEAIRDTGIKVVQGARAISDAVVNMGEEMLGVRSNDEPAQAGPGPSPESPSNA